MRSTTDTATTLFGRRRECDRLDRLIADARNGLSSSLVVRGEAGVGKSALLDYVQTHAAGCRVLRAAGVESEMELTFAAVHQLCAPFLNHRERLPSPQSDALGSAFGLTSGPPPDRFLVGLAVLSLLADGAESQPLVCLVDDAQWIDQASAQVLGFVARRLAAESVVIVLAARAPADTPYFAALQEMTIGPLEEPEARAVLESAITGKLDHSVRDRILDEAGGNPLALVELAHAWKPMALAGGFGLPDGASVSAKIEEIYRRRVATLPHDTRRMLLVVAAEPAGDRAVIHAAWTRLGIPHEAADAAVAAALVDLETQTRFRHPLLRSIVYREAPVADRREVHRALAESTDPAIDPDRRAWHLAAAAAGPDEDIAAELERSAARAQARGGPAAAAAFHERAVALSSDPGRRAERALVAAQASFQAGAFDLSGRLLATAEESRLDEFQGARAELLRGHLTVVKSYGRDGARSLLEAARRLEPFDLELARRAYLTAWGAAVTAGYFGEAGVFAEICSAVRGLPTSVAPHPIDLVLDGLVRLTTDGRAAANPTLQRAAKAVADMAVEDIILWGWVAPGASSAAWDVDGASAIHERQARLVREAGALAELPVHLNAHGMFLAWNGDLVSAELVVAEATTVAAATGTQIPPFAALRVKSLQGREAEVSPLIDTALEMARAVGQGIGEMTALWAATVLNNGLGRYEKAAASAKEVIDKAIDPWYSIYMLPELVEAASRAGDDDLARDALGRLTESTQAAGTEFGLGLEARSRALTEEGAAAEKLYRESIDRLGRTRVRTELARAHLLYGEWLRRQGRRIDARDQLGTAHEMFLTIGMEAFAERARRELLATGERVRKRSVETQDQLTPQETQIARLAGDGRTNPEIGAQLFLSRRTVEWHLRKVFDKLDVRSRRELPKALARATHARLR